MMFKVLKSSMAVPVDRRRGGCDSLYILEFKRSREYSRLKKQLVLILDHRATIFNLLHPRGYRIWYGDVHDP